MALKMINQKETLETYLKEGLIEKFFDQDENGNVVSTCNFIFKMSVKITPLVPDAKVPDVIETEKSFKDKFSQDGSMIYLSDLNVRQLRSSDSKKFLNRWTLETKNFTSGWKSTEGQGSMFQYLSQVIQSTVTQRSLEPD